MLLAYLLLKAVFFGANDACLPGSSNDQHVPLDQFKNNLKAILTHPGVVAQKPRLILITPPPVNEDRLEECDLVKGLTDPRRTAEHTKKYADATCDVGAELGVVVFDIWSLFMAKAGWKAGEPLVGSKKVARNAILDKLLVDGQSLGNSQVLSAKLATGLHFLPAAYKLMYESMMDLIRREWPDQDPESLYHVFPAWTEAPR